METNLWNQMNMKNAKGKRRESVRNLWKKGSKGQHHRLLTGKQAWVCDMK